MKMKTLCLATALAVFPAISFAFCTHSSQQQAQSCATGMVWDTQAQRCVEQVSS